MDYCYRDEDMQSLASLMSMKQADIGNLDDFEEDNEDDEDNRVNQEEKAAKITGWLYFSIKLVHLSLQSWKHYFKNSSSAKVFFSSFYSTLFNSLKALNADL